MVAGGDIYWDRNDESEVAGAAHLHPGIVTNNLYASNPNRINGVSSPSDAGEAESGDGDFLAPRHGFRG